MCRYWLPLLSGMFVLAGAACGQTVSVPNVVESTADSGLSTPLRNAARTYQAYYGPSNFGAITQPVLITGMQFRLALGSNSGVTGGTYPGQPLTFAGYDVQLSRASAAVQSAGGFDGSTAFAANQGGTVTTARTGSLTVAAGSFTNAGGTTPNPYGSVIAFTTPYQYTPGQELVLTLRHTGYAQAEPQAFFASATYAQGVADAVSSEAGAAALTPDGFSDPVFVQFTFTPVPEPGFILAAAAGAAGVLALRRRPKRDY